MGLTVPVEGGFGLCAGETHFAWIARAADGRDVVTELLQPLAQLVGVDPLNDGTALSVNGFGLAWCHELGRARDIAPT